MIFSKGLMGWKTLWDGDIEKTMEGKFSWGDIDKTMVGKFSWGTHLLYLKKWLINFNAWVEKLDLVLILVWLPTLLPIFWSESVFR